MDNPQSYLERAEEIGARNAVAEADAGVSSDDLVELTPKLPCPVMPMGGLAAQALTAVRRPRINDFLSEDTGLSLANPVTKIYFVTGLARGMKMDYNEVRRLADVAAGMNGISAERRLLALGYLAARLVSLEHLVDEMDDVDQIISDAARMRPAILTSWTAGRGLTQQDLQKNPLDHLAKVLRACPLPMSLPESDHHLKLMVNESLLERGGDVDAAAGHLRSIGKKVTVRAVRDVVGSGSHSSLLEDVRENRRKFLELRDPGDADRELPSGDQD